MLSYDIAKRLKESGYPQCGLFHGFDRFVTNGSSMSDEADKAVNGNLETKTINKPCEHITLSELIQACDGETFALKNLPDDTWLAEGGIGTLACPSHYGTGSTPEIAVANLWLALHTK